MLRLLDIEFHKLKHNKASRVLIIIYFALLTSIALIATIKFPIGRRVSLADLGIFNFPFIWHFNTFIAAFLKIFLLLIIVSMMSNEYSYKTLKQNLIDGLSKKEFILSKFYAVVVVSIISTLFVFIVSLILGLIYSDFNEFSIIFSDLEYLAAYFVKLLGFFSMGLFFGILIKRSAFAVATMIVYFLAETISYATIAGKYSTELADSIFQFLPFKAMWDLIKEPITRLGAVQATINQIGGEINVDHSVYLSNIIVVLVWTAIFVFGSYVLLKKRDL